MNDKQETKKEWETPVIVDFKEIGETSSKPINSTYDSTSGAGAYVFGPTS